MGVRPKLTAASQARQVRLVNHQLRLRRPAFRELERPIGLTDSNNYTWVNGVLYSGGSQMTNASFPAGAEVWGYNRLYQLTGRTTTPSGKSPC